MSDIINDIVDGILNIEDKNTRAVIYGQLWWRHFGNLNRMPEDLSELRDLVGRPFKKVTQQEIDEAVETHLNHLPENMRTGYGEYEPHDVEATRDWDHLDAHFNGGIKDETAKYRETTFSICPPQERHMAGISNDYC